MKLMTRNPKMAALYGKKPDAVDKMIMLRSELTHTELQFSERYGNISFSATRQDGCKCARFKMIGYTHPERWQAVEFDVTEEQEDVIFRKCCEMADVNGTMAELMVDMPRYSTCYCGPDALKYDTPAVLFSFITKWEIWRGHRSRVFCTEACFIALLEAFPDLLEIGESDVVTTTICYADGRCGDISSRNYITKLEPDQLLPSIGHYIAERKLR